jgi:hypothetical protein
MTEPTGPGATTEQSSNDPLAALNQVLSEVVDMAVTTRQAGHAVPRGHELHAELDRLFASARGWAEQLVGVDSAMGVSALAYMTSPTGRLPSGPQPSPGSEEEVGRAVGQQLGRLAAHVRAAMGKQEDARVRELLGRINMELQPHLDALPSSSLDG